MVQMDGGGWIQSNQCTGRAMAAVEFQSTVLRQKAGGKTLGPSHTDILDMAVEAHHKQMSQLVVPPKPTQHVSEVRLNAQTSHQDTPISFVDEFDSEDEPLEDEVLPQPVISPAANKKVKEADPVEMLKRIRSCSLAHHPALQAAKGPASHIVVEEFELPDDDETDSGVRARVKSLRGKSFLDRNNTQGAADSMLAQLRSKPSNLGPVRSFAAAKSESFLQPSRQASNVTMVTQLGGAKSFTGQKRPGNLPPVQVNSPLGSPRGSSSQVDLGPASSSTNSPRRAPAATSPAAAGGSTPSSPGLLGKLKSMMKRGG